MARRVPAGSPQWVLLHMLRDVLDPTWAPGPSAARLVEKVPQAPVLHHTRARLRAATWDRTTVWEARALATLNLAIDHLERDGGRSPRAAAGGGVGEQGEPGRR